MQPKHPPIHPLAKVPVFDLSKVVFVHVTSSEVKDIATKLASTKP